MNNIFNPVLASIINTLKAQNGVCWDHQMKGVDEKYSTT
jgi:hypothetical protein